MVCVVYTFGYRYGLLAINLIYGGYIEFVSTSKWHGCLSTFSPTVVTAGPNTQNNVVIIYRDKYSICRSSPGVYIQNPHNPYFLLYKSRTPSNFIHSSSIPWICLRRAAAASVIFQVPFTVSSHPNTPNDRSKNCAILSILQSPELNVVIFECAARCPSS